MSTRQLPPKSNLRQLKSQAKDLRKAAVSRDAAALTRIRSSHPRHESSTEDELAGLSLQDAQLVVAREYGFDSWPRLTEAVDVLPVATSFAQRLKDSIIGSSLETIRVQLARAVETGVPALLTGERGTGKRLMARTLHALHGGPIAEVNCDSRPGSLGESDIFGFEEGAFTGAHVSTPGKLEEAAGGTLVLDEVGHLSLQAQVRLLEAIESGTYRRLGGSQEWPFNVRLVCTTSTDLRALVETGDLREDLYFRLQVLRIDLLPLRQRQQDIPALVQHFISSAPRVPGASAPRVQDEVLTMLQAQQWLGNVRELRHVVEAAALAAEQGQIGLQHIRIESRTTEQAA
jgi:DNA-binding NtrC family response regulator